MKIVDEFRTIDNDKIKKTIKESAELIRDIIHMQHELVDDYAKYRILKALDKIETFNKETKQKMGKLMDAIGSAAGGNIIGAGLGIGGMLLDNNNAQNQLEDQMQLMDQQMYNQQTLNQQQHHNQQALNQQGHELQMQMWENTNAPAQVGMLREAGLNPALMYKQGGAGGVTGNQGGGSAQGGNATGGQAMQRRQLMDMQNLMMGAQLKKLKADTKLVDAQANNEAGGVKEKLDAQVGQIRAQEKLTVAQEGKTNAEAWLTKQKAELAEMDVNQYKINGLSPQDGIVIKTLTRAGMTIGDAWEWLWNTSTKEKMEYIYPLRNEIWDKWIQEWKDKGINFGDEGS